MAQTFDFNSVTPLKTDVYYCHSNARAVCSMDNSAIAVHRSSIQVCVCVFCLRSAVCICICRLWKEMSWKGFECTGRGASRVPFFSQDISETLALFFLVPEVTSQQLDFNVCRSYSLIYFNRKCLSLSAWFPMHFLKSLLTL